MKKLLLGLSLLATSLAANATHLMGGEITAKQLTNGQYKITLTYYRDTLGIPLSNTEVVDIYAMSGVGGGGFGMMYPAVTLNFDTAASLALVPSFPYGVQTGVYVKDSLTLPGGIYRIISNTCCRNGAILNAAQPLSESLVLYTDLTVPATGNSSPMFLAMPIAHFAVNATTTYNPLPFDPDADSIAWDYNVPLGTYNSGAPTTMLPVAGFGPLQSMSAFSMNPITGEITWTPTVTGNFIESFKINEYKNGVLSGTIIRDMQYVVLPQDTTNTPPSFSMVSSYNTNNQYGYYYNYYNPGHAFTFQIRGTSPNPNANLTLTSLGEPYQMAAPATFSVTGTGNNVLGTFNWTPPANLTRDVLVSFRVGNGIFTKDFTLLMRKNSSTGVKNTAANIESFSVYPNPAKNEVNVSMELGNKLDGNISVYNSLGQNVTTIYNGLMNKGSIRLNSKLSLPSGTYFVVLKGTEGVLKTQSISIQ